MALLIGAIMVAAGVVAVIVAVSGTQDQVFAMLTGKVTGSSSSSSSASATSAASNSLVQNIACVADPTLPFCPLMGG